MAVVHQWKTSKFVESLTDEQVVALAAVIDAQGVKELDGLLMVRLRVWSDEHRKEVLKLHQQKFTESVNPSEESSAEENPGPLERVNECLKDTDFRVVLQVSNDRHYTDLTAEFALLEDGRIVCTSNEFWKLREFLRVEMGERFCKTTGLADLNEVEK